MNEAALAAVPSEPSSPSPTGRAWGRTAGFWLLALGAYWVALFFGTHIPEPQGLTRRLIAHDKLVHAAAYAVLATLALVAWRRTGGLTTWTVRAACGVAILGYGVIDELTQPLVGRSCDLWDWVADGVGVTLAWVVDGWRHPADRAARDEGAPGGRLRGSRGPASGASGRR